MVEPIPLRGTSLHDGVAARLRSMVFERQLAPGQWIDEKALAQAWSVSRTPLREALKVLAAEGLVELVPQRGCRVIELSDDDADDLFPVMALLEGRCAHEAVAKARRRRHRRAAAPARRAGAPCRRARHRRLLPRQPRVPFARAGTGRQPLARPHHRRPAQASCACCAGASSTCRGASTQSINEHRVLIDAFEQRDAARAERAMHDHLMAQLQALKQLRALETRSGEAHAG
jgi:DNA-binding GntR family transcriptional regulator